MRNLRNGHVQDLGQKSLKRQLPYSDPQFRYLESRNPYAARIDGLPAYCLRDNAAEGQFVVPPGAELHIEIGCNGGHVLIPMAKAQPTARFVGLDWKYKQIFKAGEKAKKLGLSNIRLIRAYAERISFLFERKSIDHLHLFFPDPWERRSQWKNRYITAERWIELHALMKMGGIFEIRTDHAEYFDWMLSALKQANQPLNRWQIVHESRNRHADQKQALELKIPEITLFEQIFIREKKPVHWLLLKAL